MPTTTNFGWTTPADTDLVKDGAAAIRTLAGNIDTSLVDLKGGTSGQVLSKNSNTDLDFAWVAQDDSNAIQNAIIDAKGDLIVGTADDTPARLAVGGTNGHVLKVDSSTASGLAWGALPSSAPASASATIATEQSTTSTSYTDLATSGPAVTLTTGTKALVIFTSLAYASALNYESRVSFAVSGSTTIAASDSNGSLRARMSNGESDATRFSVATFVTLTAGSNTFTMKYKAGGVTSYFSNREIIVIDLGS
jgi:hypothetical protein